MSEALPLALENAILSGDCVLFLGAGTGAHARDPGGNPAPTGGALATELATHFGVDTGGADPDLAKVARL